MLDHALSPQQLAVICALSTGATMTAAAQEAGVHRNTIANWRRNSLPFQQALAHAQYDHALYYREKAGNLADLAIKSIEEILSDPDAPPSVRLKAALAIITTVTTPPAPQPQSQPPDTHKDAQSQSQPQNPPSSAFSGGPTDFSSSSTNAQLCTKPHPIRSTKIGRNEPCPCGSGKKHKRCCLGKPLVRPEFVQRLASAA